MKRLAFVISILTLPTSAADLQLDPALALRRASLLIRGRGLDVGELASAGARDLNAKIDQYVRDDGFYRQMNSNLSYLFRVRPRIGQGHASPTTLSMQFDRIVRNNLSWDELLTSKVIFFNDRSGWDLDRSFYQGGLKKEDQRRLDEQYGQGVSKAFEAVFSQGNGPSGFDEMISTSPGVSGVLTDRTFLGRYLTNPVNQNRKRAAAVYRIFLCDDMRAVVLPDDRVNAEIESLGLDDNAGAHASPNADVNRHADDPKCASCHYKLDDLAQGFRGQGTRLTRSSVSGALNFRRRSGELVSVPFRNASELGQALVRQPEYAACQVRHFWDWFIGADVPMSAAAESELVRQFDAVGRRPRDFVSYLMKRREAFRFPELSAESITFAHVSGVLEQCTRCHESAKIAPDYRQMPIPRFGMTMEGDNIQRMHDYNLETLVTAMDLLGDGARATMPTNNAGWSVSPDDRARLLAWLAGGARDASGRVTWLNADLRAQLRTRVAQENLNFRYRPTLGYTARRRMSLAQVKSTLANWVRGLGRTSSLEIMGAAMDDDPGAPVKIDSGIASVAPSAEYVRGLHQIAVQVQAEISWTPSVRRRFESNSIFASTDGLIQNLALELWGRPADARELKRLKDYLAGPGAENPVALIGKMIESENFVTF